ncbi:TonB-dependent receptor domain-containing protein [Sphingomonas sp.]|uniref:TonB-dependent receptor plug domain-containing protein n=1 Tax=Sphingomonas sp. TaxID=28214 RepID=UPI00286ADF2C|nr:TonB-dependent receptor [Sphingomonas sp.]
MRKTNLRATAGRQALALLGAGVFAAAPAAAQTAPDGTTPPSSETQPSASQQPAAADPVAKADDDDAIVITGSRIARPDLEGPSPVTTVSAEQFDLTGTVTVETLLNELPQVIPGNTRTSNNQGGEDFSTIDLRGLGPQRTLILVDGERVPASSTTGVVDIGTIPAGLIERVDVVTGGASAVYGSDAMAGVVNFILKDNYEGLEVTSQYSITDHGDGGAFNIQGLLGGNFGDDRGNMTFFASYYTREPIGQGDRDVTRNAGVIYYDYATSQYFVADHLTPTVPGSTVLVASGGSATPPWGFVVNNPQNAFTGLSTNPATAPRFTNVNTDCNPATPPVAAVNGGNLSFNDFGQLTPRFVSGLCAFADRSTGSSRFNFNPLNYLVTPYNRLNLATTARYDINDSIRLKVIANYTDSSQEVNLAPTPAGGSTGLVVPFNSPLIPADLAAALASRPNPTAPFNFDRRFSETGPRIGIYDSKTATLRGTLSGPLAHGFNWDVTGSYGRTDAVATLKNNINRAAVNQGLRGCQNSAGVVNGPGVLPGCVPLDIFGPDTLTPSMVAFVGLDTKETRSFDQARVAGNITGNLVDLPAGPVGIAVGVEARTDRGEIIVDDAQRTGNIIGFNATQNQKGKVNTKEVYGEVRVPILADKPFFHELSIEAGARYSDYSSVGSLFNYKLGAQWSPVDWLKFRGIYNKAARAPSIVELFQNGDQGFPSYVDFCADPPGAPVLSPGLLALCQAQVVQAGGPAGYNFTGFDESNAQVQAFAFGNPGLSEETAKTYTVGAVLTPNLGIGRFSATIDYYNIKIEDLVTTLGSGFYLNACANSLDPNSDACLRIRRDPVTAQVSGIDTSIANQGTLKTSGVDVGINFAVPFSDLGLGLPGRFRVQELLSWLDKYDFNGTDFGGTSGGGIGGTIPEWKSTLTVAYDSSSFTAQVRWNWQSDVEDIAFCNPGDNCAPKLKGLSYFDLSLRKKIGSNFELTGIVQNLFNQKAEKTVAGFFAEGGTDVSYFNPIILGRTLTISGRVKL